MAKRQRPITIRSTKELEQLNNLYVDLDVPFNGAAKFDIIAGIMNPQTNRDHLYKWLNDHGIDLCEHGFKKVLASAGKLRSWPKYFRKHWNDKDGFIDWFNDAHYEMFDHSLFSFRPENYGSYDKWLKAHRGRQPLKLAVKWPFPRKTRKKVANG